MMSDVMIGMEDTGVGPLAALRTLPAGRRILESDPEQQVRLVQAATERSVWRYVATCRQDEVLLARVESNFYADFVPGEVLKALLRRRLPLSVADLCDLYDALCAVDPVSLPVLVPLKSFLSQAEAHPGERGPSGRLAGALQSLHRHLLSAGHQTSELRKAEQRIDELLASAPSVVFDPGERWPGVILAHVGAVTGEPGRKWVELCVHLLAGESAKPSGAWWRTMDACAGVVGRDELRHCALAWLSAAGVADREPVSARNGNFLRGLVWYIARDGDEHVARAVGDLALAMSNKVPGHGMRAPKVFNACVAALGDMGGNEPLSQLSRLRGRVKAPRAQALLVHTLQDTARERGVTLAELEELVVPTFGLQDPGRLTQQVGDWTAKLHIAGTDRVHLTWTDRAGRGRKSVPATLERDHAEVVEELRRTTRDLAAMLPAQRDRLEQQLLTPRVLLLDQWRARYVDHVVLGPLSRRLVWQFEDGGRVCPGAWVAGSVVDVDDLPMEWLEPSTRVRLWHPIASDGATVKRWRDWLEAHSVSQPFKQAYREIYVLADAERTTATYSDRFAAHVVRQHQLAALCRARGWRYQLQGWFDNANSPTRELGDHGLRAEFVVEPCAGSVDSQSASGIALYATTDQVRFLDSTGAPISVAGVPPVVFSEVMRDVDLFVGVASVGADPAWVDCGERPEWNDYWREYSFGGLSASAETRREALERLVPKLAIASRCVLEGRFLVVRGDVRTYKIHLGSGNILMEPDDQYLCIVPDRGMSARSELVWLPFEGDSVLSTILSKAFLLAADTRITDETILRQIHARS